MSDFDQLPEHTGTWFKAGKGATPAEIAISIMVKITERPPRTEIRR